MYVGAWLGVYKCWSFDFEMFPPSSLNMRRRWFAGQRRGISRLGGYPCALLVLDGKDESGLRRVINQLFKKCDDNTHHFHLRLRSMWHSPLRPLWSRFRKATMYRRVFSFTECCLNRVVALGVIATKKDYRPRVNLRVPKYK